MVMIMSRIIRSARLGWLGNSLMNHQLLNEIAKESGVELDNEHITFARKLITKCLDLALEEWYNQEDANESPAANAIAAAFFQVDN